MKDVEAKVKARIASRNGIRYIAEILRSDNVIVFSEHDILSLAKAKHSCTKQLNKLGLGHQARVSRDGVVISTRTALSTWVRVHADITNIPNSKEL